MENAAAPGVIVIETVEVSFAPSDRSETGRRPWRRHGATQRSLVDEAAARPALVTIAGALLGYSLVRFFSGRKAAAENIPATRRIAVTRSWPRHEAEASGAGLKRHGDKYASAIRAAGGEDRAPTYPEG